jgi:chromosome partitioning protein
MHGTPPSRVIALVNQKGGCGKTTTAVNLSACLAALGHDVLLVDLDPQANATVSLGIDPAELPHTLYHVLVDAPTDGGSVRLEDILRPSSVDRLVVAPSSIDLAGAELELVARMGREHALRRKLQPVRDRFDFVLVDTPPSLGLLTLNALVACDQVIIPIQTHYYALLGMRQLMRTLQMVRDEVGHAVEILGVVATMYDARNNISKEIVRGIYEFFGDRVFDTTIHFSIKLVESAMVGVPIFLHQPQSRGAQEYMALAKEVIAREQVAGRAAARN